MPIRDFPTREAVPLENRVVSTTACTMDQYKIFAIKYDSKLERFDDVEFQNFVRQNNVTSLQTHFFAQNSEAIWTAFVVYETKLKGKNCSPK